MVSFAKRAVLATLSICWNLLIIVEAMPYGGMLPSSPVMDSSPWMPIASPKYMSYESFGDSHDVPYGSQAVPLQTAFIPARSPAITPESNTSTMPEAPGLISWLPAAPQATEAPAVGSWGQPNPTLADASDAIPPAPQEVISTGPLPVVPYWMRSSNNSPMSPLPAVAEQVADVPANEFPQSENPWALSQPSPPEVQQQENVETNAVFNPVQDLGSSVSEGLSQDNNWPETPRVVQEADKLPALPPATFGQFAVQPAR